jgi:hypothetical protein
MTTEPECPICLDTDDDHSAMQCLPCPELHWVHRACWREVVNKEICPVCRGSLTTTASVTSNPGRAPSMAEARPVCRGSLTTTASVTSDPGRAPSMAEAQFLSRMERRVEPEERVFTVGLSIRSMDMNDLCLMSVGINSMVRNLTIQPAKRKTCQRCRRSLPSTAYSGPRKRICESCRWRLIL